MKPVRVQPRFKCDFCLKRSVKSVMEKHEPRCFRNPNRFCDTCENTGKVTVEGCNRDFALVGQPCPYCSKFDPQMLKEIQEREMSTLDAVSSASTVRVKLRF